MDAGNSLCQLVATAQLSSNQESDGLWHLRYEAVVEALDSLTLAKGATYSQASQSFNSNPLEEIDNMAAKGNALDRALDACYSAGADHCVILGLDFQEVNQQRSDGQFYTTANASVRGYTQKP